MLCVYQIQTWTSKLGCKRPRIERNRRKRRRKRQISRYVTDLDGNARNQNCRRSLLGCFWLIRKTEWFVSRVSFLVGKLPNVSSNSSRVAPSICLPVGRKLWGLQNYMFYGWTWNWKSEFSPHGFFFSWRMVLMVPCAIWVGTKCSIKMASSSPIKLLWLTFTAFCTLGISLESR